MRKENMGHIRQGEKVLLFSTSFFFSSPLLSLPPLFSLGPLLYISMDHWHVFSLNSHCTGGTEEKDLCTNQERQNAGWYSNLVTWHTSRVHPPHTHSYCAQSQEEMTALLILMKNPAYSYEIQR